MNTDHSFATTNHEYQPTIIEDRVLIERLVIQIAFAGHELKRAWSECNKNPIAFAAWLTTHTLQRLRNLLATPHLVPAATTAVIAVFCTTAIVLLVNGGSGPTEDTLADANEHAPEIVMLNLAAPPPLTRNSGSGGPVAKSSGTGGGGNRDPHPPQAASYRHRQ